MKILKLSALSLLLTLTACGGGGGKGSAPSTPVNPVNKVEQTTPAVNHTGSTNSASTNQNTGGSQPSSPSSTSTTSSTPKPVHGHYLVGVDRGKVGITAFTLSGDRLEVLNHFGSIPLSDPAQSPTDGYYKIGNGIVNDSSFLKETKFGIIENNRQVYIFAQGNRATEMPISGTASYTGEAILVSVDNEDEFKRLGYFAVPAKFTADFGQKQLTGSLQLMELGADNNVVFNAEIEGDEFSNWGGLDGISVDGAFYGKNASELGGVLLKRDAFSGSFGAKKDQ